MTSVDDLMNHDLYHEAVEEFAVISDFHASGVVKVQAQAGVGFVCEVVVTHVPDSRSSYEYLVSVVQPVQRVYGVNTFDPHSDYLHEKFVGSKPISPGEFALLTMTIRRALALMGMRQSV